MDKMNNPAGRLHHLLSRGQKLDPKQSVAAAWKQLLNIPNSDSSILLYRLGPVWMLPHETRLAVLQLDHVDHELYLTWQGNVERALQLPLSSGWEHFRATLNKGEGTLRMLAACADQLSRVAPEPTVEAPVLTDLLSSARNLHEDVLKTAMDPVLKLFLLKHLREIETAIENYHVQGAPGISRAANDAIGEIILIKGGSIAPQVATEPLGQRFAKLVTRVAATAQFGANVVRIADGGASITDWLLTAPPPIIEQSPDSLTVIDTSIVDGDGAQ